MTQTVEPRVAASSEERAQAGVFSQARTIQRAIFASPARFGAGRR